MTHGTSSGDVAATSVKRQRSYSIPLDLTRAAGGAKLNVYVALAERCNDEGTCFPSLARIASDVGTSRRNVAYILQWLEENGWVIRKRRFRDGVHRSTLYLLPAQVRTSPLVKSSSPLVKPVAQGGSEVDCTGGSEVDCTHNSSQYEHLSDSKASPPKTAKVAKRNEIFDAVKIECELLGKQPPNGLVTEIAKRVTSTGRDAGFVTRLAFWLAEAEHVNLVACSPIERSRVLGSVRVIGQLTTDKAEIRRRMELCKRRSPKYPAKTLADDWSQFERDAPPEPQRGSVVDQNAAVIARAKEALDRVDHRSDRELIGSGR